MRFFTPIVKNCNLEARIEEGCFADTCFDFFQIEFCDVGENGQIRLEGNMRSCVVFIAGSDFFQVFNWNARFIPLEVYDSITVNGHLHPLRNSIDG